VTARWGKRGLGAALVALLALGCERDPLDVPCPEAGVGELVVTEIRGTQAGEDLDGEWIEIFNRSGQPVDLLGLRVRLSTLNGGSRNEFIVRRSLQVANDSYVTLGRFLDGSAPEHVNYGYAGELDREINSTGAIQLFACGFEVDQVIYRSLPSTGTLALDGAIVPPDATANDLEENFCVDENGRGTPQQENPPCS
jgi:hypothetical protein